MNYARETIQKAFKIYQEKHGGSLAEVSILFVNVMDALSEAAQHSAQADTLPRCEISRECYFGQDGCCLRGGECR